MRLRVGAVLCLFLAVWAAGCRKAVAPSLDNQAPETWIVAAPQDTITIRDNSGPIRPNVGRIPVRFHLYWAGADRDGAVAGYYFAVVETLAVPPEGLSSVPGLPGPKARDYQFTTKSDSIFVFRASEELNERQHAFFIYAVDNKGRADATPARFIFSSYDRFPPLAIIDELKAVGTIYELQPGGGVRPVERTYFVTDSFELSPTHVVPRDTIPANARISVRWHGEPTIPSTVIMGYRYKLDETSFNVADSSVRSAEYNTGVGLDRINTGQKVFTLRAIGQSGWRGESTRWFQMNFAPDTWFAGPDVNALPAGWQTFTSNAGAKRYWFYDNAFPASWDRFPGLANSMLSSDSLTKLPAERTERKTFFEVYNDRVWVHQEGDTVHLNSWVIFPSGGFDRDSPYRARINTALLPPELKDPSYTVLAPTGPNGSPIGFRVIVRVRGGTDIANSVGQPSETTTYPVIDPASVFHNPVMNGYWGQTTAGTAYGVVYAEDGDGTVDRRIDQLEGGAAGVAERVNVNPNTGVMTGGSAEDKLLRSKVIKFFVDRAPRFLPGVTALVPGTPIPGRAINFNLPADDVDPLDPKASFNRVGGTPAGTSPILRRKIAILGKFNGSVTPYDTCYVEPNTFTGPQGNGIQVRVPNYIAGGAVTAIVRLCDCLECDDLKWPKKTLPIDRTSEDRCPFTNIEPNPGSGRCIEIRLNVTIGPSPGEPASLTSGVSNDTTQRPGSSSDSGRRRQ